ncbi:MAG TPA: hypothetical protein VGA85_01370 [Dehalococcoidales bacterium]
MYSSENSAHYIRVLKNELDGARYTIIRLMPKDVQHLFNGYIQCQSREEYYRWQTDVVNQIIQKATIIPEYKDSIFGERAFCPLCGEESSSPYASGFSLPEGLRRHLTGWGNVSRCSVMSAVFGLAEDYLQYRFEEQDKVEAFRENERRRSESLFIISYGSDPRLIDEVIRGTARTPESLAFAEKRLRELGFSLNTDGNIKSYTLDRDNVLVFADPRAEGHIDFTIYKKPLTKKAQHSGLRCYSFSFQDKWRIKLKEKFDQRIAESMKYFSTQ